MKCLFTGRILDDRTREEHTIPCALAGRVRSRSVSSTEFNECCGRSFDQQLTEPYQLIMQKLSPLLAHEHRSESGEYKVDVPADSGQFVLQNGVLTLKGIRIDTRDPVSGRPTGFSVDPSAVGKAARKLGMATQVLKQTPALPTESSIYGRRSVAFCPEMEIAALKSALLTFDAKLERDQQRFTRSDKLYKVREFVRTAVLERKWSGINLRQYSLGIQYDKLEAIEKLRSRLIPLQSEFEHVLVASGNMATRTLDMVWLIAGTDPFGFRVCNEWDEGDFTCTIINDMLVGGEVRGPFWGSLPTNVCAPTSFRSFPDLMPNDTLLRHMIHQIAFHRQHMFRRAIRLVENRCDARIIDGLMNIAIPNHENNHKIEVAVKVRLKGLYKQRLENSHNREMFERILKKHLNALPLIDRSCAVVTETDRLKINWPSWLRVYRCVLGELEGEMGLPGEVLIGEIEFEHLPLEA